MSDLAFYTTAFFSIVALFFIVKTAIKFISGLIQVALTLIAIILVTIFISNYTGCDTQINPVQDFEERVYSEQKPVHFSQKNYQNYSFFDK